MTDSSPMASAAGELSRERDRLVGRLRSMRLEAVPTEAVRRAGQLLEDLAARHRGEPARVVPALAPYAAGDQLYVLVAEVLATEDPAAALAATETLGRLRAELAIGP